MLDRKDGMITVDDGIRRLRLLDAKGKVWTQEMLLQVEEKMVSLIDLGTKVRLKTRIYFWFCFLWGGGCLFVCFNYKRQKKNTDSQCVLSFKLSVTHSDFDLWVFLLQNELENFQIGSIQHCQAVMNACSYDSILALICKEPGQVKPDLHLFQCDEIKVNSL